MTKNARSTLLSFKPLKLANFWFQQLGYNKTVKFNKWQSIFIASNVTESVFQRRNTSLGEICLLREIIFLNNFSVQNMFFEKCVFSVSSSNMFLIYSNKGMQVTRNQVLGNRYSLIQEHSPYLSPRRLKILSFQ